MHRLEKSGINCIVFLFSISLLLIVGCRKNIPSDETNPNNDHERRNSQTKRQKRSKLKHQDTNQQKQKDDETPTAEETLLKLDEIEKLLKDEQDFSELLKKINQENFSFNKIINGIKNESDSVQRKGLEVIKKMINLKGFSYKDMAKLAINDPLANIIKNLTIEQSNLNGLQTLTTIAILLIKKSSFQDLKNIRVPPGIKILEYAEKLKAINKESIFSSTNLVITELHIKATENILKERDKNN